MNTPYNATLPWYDSDKTRTSLDLLWQAMAQFLQKNGVENVPAALQRQSAPSQLWQSPQLIISQCCGPDLFTPEGASLCVIGKPVFANLDCTPGCYYSHIISRQIEYNRTTRIAVNSISSHSGHYALTEWLEAREIEVSQLCVSGSHMNSLSILEKDVADYAALDAHLVDQFGVRIDMPVVGRSTESLAPPFVFHRNANIDKDLLYEALKHAIDRRGTEVGIIDLIKCDRSDYQNPGARDVATGDLKKRSGGSEQFAPLVPETAEQNNATVENAHILKQERKDL